MPVEDVKKVIFIFKDNFLLCKRSRCALPLATPACGMLACKDSAWGFTQWRSPPPPHLPEMRPKKPGLKLAAYWMIAWIFHLSSIIRIRVFIPPPPPTHNRWAGEFTVEDTAYLWITGRNSPLGTLYNFMALDHWEEFPVELTLSLCYSMVFSQCYPMELLVEHMTTIDQWMEFLVEHMTSIDQWMEFLVEHMTSIDQWTVFSAGYISI